MPIKNFSGLRSPVSKIHLRCSVIPQRKSEKSKYSFRSCDHKLLDNAVRNKKPPFDWLMTSPSAVFFQYFHKFHSKKSPKESAENLFTVPNLRGKKLGQLSVFAMLHDRTLQRLDIDECRRRNRNEFPPLCTKNSTNANDLFVRKQ